MKLVYKYSLNHFLSTNLSLFLVLFLIVSMVFFIQLARLTASIEISFLDFLKLYSFMIPRILIFTLPISFFIALTLALYRLSRENESIVCFALGFSPKEIGYFFLKIACLLSAFMLVVALVFIPVAAALQSNFVDFKKTQVKLNLKTGEFGQKFLDWLVFIEKENQSLYENIIMYHPSTKTNPKEQLIIAKEGVLDRVDQSLAFKLSDGKVYSFEQNNTWYLGHFDTLVVNTLLSGFDTNKEPFYRYWNDMNSNEKKAKEFVIYTLIALFPVASTFFALCFGLVTYRYEKGFVYFGIFGVIALYFGALSVFYQPPLLAVILIFLIFLLASVLYFKFKILSRY
ncbi:hypothetical protein DMB95_03325 [Campylobacter sp. MIT 12-8780]|uniref:LptF/LptG family permease n=1 Tax=unclassified Campylobacter TaxID=2593542 RepID=UPI00115C93C5|nr:MULTISPECIES: LptF/LptG family permease [unclassified Campylobacter]NDJ26904.1 LptF/LptG family permease [Campylobacter sp. MIT 19-121]TQR41952.1 hypothetical protein DMB95_03325 [Campylobacter sp. MIT 12-8780]